MRNLNYESGGDVASKYCCVCMYLLLMLLLYLTLGLITLLGAKSANKFGAIYTLEFGGEVYIVRARRRRWNYVYVLVLDFYFFIFFLFSFFFSQYRVRDYNETSASFLLTPKGDRLLRLIDTDEGDSCCL